MSAAATDDMALQTVAPLVRRGLTAEPSAGAYGTGISTLFVPFVERALRSVPTGAFRHRSSATRNERTFDEGLPKE